MIDPNRLERVRTVEDVDRKGTLISKDVLRTDRDTVFPLQAALGYDLAQTLFIGPNCLLVEGPSDLVYLQVLNDCIVKSGYKGLDPKWVIVPIGGADKIATFVSLMGANKLNIAVLIDITSKDKQRVKNLQDNAFLGNDNIINIGEIVDSPNADIEDIFEPYFYLKLVNGGYSEQLGTDLTLELMTSSNPRIIKRIEEHFRTNNIAEGRFNHYIPSVYLLKNVNLLSEIDKGTMERAEVLFTRINSLLN